MKRSVLLLVLLILCFFLLGPLNAQTKVVYGSITAFNQYPLQNIEVVAKKGKTTVKTDSLGRFSIVCMEKDVIRIRPKAFKSAMRKVGAKTDSLRINLVFIDNEANREIATGYGYINSQDLSYAVNHLKQENNEFCNYKNVYDLIRGRFPGVRVDRSQNGGAVFVRGATSINQSSEALYVVDGSRTNSLDWIHPCEIRTIDVIKDGMTSIYGSSGANGVVVIETKKGL